MADGRKRPRLPEGPFSSRTKHRFSLPNYPDTRRSNMKKATAGVLVVLGMFLTPGAIPYAPKTQAPIYEPHRMTWPEFREDLHRRKAFRRTVRMPKAKIRKKKTNDPALDNNADVFSWESSGKKRKFRKFTSPVRTALSV